jgi:LPS export ABC transporter protein LptC
VRTEKKKTYLCKIKLELFKKGERVCVVLAENGVFDRESKEIELLGNVEAETADGMKLCTERLVWKDRERVFFTDEKVLFRKGNTAISGVGFSSAIDLSFAEIKGDVSVVGDW